MISKNKIKLLRSLKVKKYREKNNKSILEGVRLIDESLNLNADIQGIWMTKDIINSNKDFIKKIKLHNMIFDIIDNKDLEMITDTKNSQGVIAEVNIKQYFISEFSKLITENIIVLDNISDPGNIGNIFRTCAWYGIKSILLTSNTADAFNPKCLRAGMGAHFYFDHIITGDNKNIIDGLNKKKYNILCADLKGNKLSTLNIKNKWALILGSEAHGLHREFNHFSKVTINKIGDIESLNVSVACGIILNKIKSK